MNISERSNSPFPFLISSDSINDVVAKHQQVLVAAWFLTGVALSSTSVLKTYFGSSSAFEGPFPFFFWLKEGCIKMTNVNIKSICFFIVIFKLKNEAAKIKYIPEITIFEDGK